MTTLAGLTGPLVRLFLRIDAAQPSDEVLRAASDFWHKQRRGRIMPLESEMAQLPGAIAPHTFTGRSTTNGSRQWILTNAGRDAAAILQIKDEVGIGNRRIAVRLRKLFDMVADKSEPISAMFELAGAGKKRQLVEIFVAPVTGAESNTHAVFGTVNSRMEA
ncbi:MAG: hypothetical protein HY245_04600 [Rhizobiales bacterium]|nr:hypothetical protein [Hyphomicrobiales bacterium]MBI3672695.1 hypothetical protein [Hyphomicrobiales bacterium]